MPEGFPQDFRQFPPTPQRPRERGAYGWGFETGPYRVVMFGPPEADNAYVREGEWLAPNPNRPIEHGPAHVHVIERHSGRESKFLMVADKYGEHYAVAMPPTKNRLPLGRKQELACEELLRPYVPHFIQLWQEMYADNDMSACVARTEENHNGALEVQGAHGHSFVKRALLRRAAFGLEKAYG